MIMKEIEIKLKYSNEKEFRNKLKALKSKFKEEYEIVDQYYAKQGETMKNAENLLRIRTKKGKSELTFKGKRETASDVWERVEVNLDVEDAEKTKLILENLGFQLILKNRTKREYWEVDGTEVAIIKILEPAEVDFVEIEGKTKEAVEKATQLFKGVLEPIGKDHFKKLDEANG